ncbi:MAG: hypothetical protein K9M11_00780 [Candidatus Pacebacteria bacterium]|nr:hypothetical protein [Candidatus Paceibacterota bacterium]
MKTKQSKLPAAMLEIFRELFDSRMALHISCKKMLQQVKSLDVRYITSSCIQIAVMIAATCFFFKAPSWERFALTAGGLIISASVLCTWINIQKGRVKDNSYDLEDYHRLEKLFLGIWATNRIEEVRSSSVLAQVLEDEVRAAVRLILAFQEDTKTDHTSEIADLHAFVKATLAIIVRLELMGSYNLVIPDSETMDTEEMMNARARELCTKLFEDPDFRMP